MIGLDAIDGQPGDPGLGDAVQLLKQHLGQFVAEAKASFSLVLELFGQQLTDMLEQSASVFGIGHVSLDFFATLLASTGSAVELETRVAESVQAFRDKVESGLFAAFEQKLASTENFEVALTERIRGAIGALKASLDSSARSTSADFLSSKDW